MATIPKVINYCWFGKNPLPDEVKECINSWKKFLPEYEIKQWNESNFDVNCCDYVKEAYEAKKWAFVSDYARFWVLYNYGGLYFDTDVEIIKPLDHIVQSGPFLACEPTYGRKNLPPKVNPGLGMGAVSHMELYKEVLDKYETQHFFNEDGSINQETIVIKVTSILKKHGFQGNETIEHVAGIDIYPVEYFCPKNYITNEINLTENTVAIHHYSASWNSNLDKMIMKLRFSPSKNDVEYYARQVIAIPLVVLNKVLNKIKSK